ncbi:Uncharacterised protein [Raoultella terrigena]|uniref:Uncharacterized protein n=1 Tax=Raoultella terrigena TaxID=577 RepID=A0A4U9D9E4_RAOTE|nr:Uncharacterised protein [Raoultella terrigena]
MGDGYLTGGELFFKHLQQARGVPRGIEQLIDADAHPRLDALGDSIDAALDGVEIVQQVGGFAGKDSKPDSVSSMLRVLRVNSTTSSPVSMRLMV